MGTPGFAFFLVSHTIMYFQMQQDCFIWNLLMLLARFGSISDVFHSELVAAKQH